MNEKKNEFIPSKKQALFIDWYLDLTNKLTLTQICKEVQINRTTAWRWLRDKDFVKFLNDLIEPLLSRSLVKIYKTAIKEAISGHFQFAKLLLEISGEYVSKSEDILKITPYTKETREQLEKEMREELNTISERMKKAEKLKKEKLKKIGKN
ncbi:hypothetical protein ES702_02828 [subsurface metagenome]